MRPSARRASAALVLLVPLAVAPTAAAAGAPTSRATPAPLYRSAQAIPGQYIVTLKKDVTGEPGAFAETALPGVQTLFSYTSALNGFAARLTPAQLAAVRALPSVEAVEEDGVATGTPVTGSTAPAAGRRAAAASWGLDRIDQAYLPLNQQFNVNSTGKGAVVFVVDSGIDLTHSEFGGRAVAGFDSVGDGRAGTDCNGHGTHVAGTVGGATYGVAREATLVSVRVLGCDNRGSWSGIIAGFDWVAKNARPGAVLNGSLGGGRTNAVNAAATAVSDRGVLPVIAAGNDAVDACGVSPASAARVLTVGATDHNDQEANFSNFGPCLSMYAPGKAIVSAKLGGGSVALDGTSMASPHVAGVAALYKARNPDASSSDVAQWLFEQSTKDTLAVTKGSPNRLLYTGGL
ncbi:S8 family peptidase [Kitasatospora sp. NPDC094015]|uniref:S8 family peptidase n=1 Tax=Kitasatospora sp. NPDC094015 TaxID=3155205 RepID=UPI00332CE673